MLIGMSTDTPIRRGLEPAARRITLSLPAPLAERLDEAAQRFRLARSTIAAAAIDAGLKAACDRARRAARRDARGAGK